MSSDMFGPLNGKPDNTTLKAQETNTCLPAGERPNKTPSFFSEIREARTFVAWLRVSCHGGLKAQLKPEKLIVVPSTANIFRSLSQLTAFPYEGEDVSFQTFMIPGTAVCGLW